MKGSRVGNRYAKALFELAVEKKLLSSIEADLQLLVNDYQKSAEFRLMMSSPVIASSVKRKIFAELYKKRLQLLTYNFIQLLFQKNREANLPDIIGSFDQLMDEHKGIIRGEVRSVAPLSPAQIKALKAHLDKLYGKDVQLEQQTDPTLLGGFIVKVQERVFDSSLRNQLNTLRTSLAES